jgi:type IV secretory pathway component VirB8
MQPNDPDEYLEIAEKVRTGEYFREARSMYDMTVHDPMAERYLYVAITALAGIILTTAIIAVQGLYPLSSSVPFIVSTNDIVEDLPRIKSVLAYKGENPSAALLRFLVNNYVALREEYNIDTFDRNISGIKSQSAPDVYGEFQQAIDPRNPDSPVAQYQRHSKRSITILSSKQLPDQQAMDVTFEAKVEGNGEVKTSTWQANIAFEYNGVTLDENTDKVKAVNFVVTRYRSKRLQD